jgi:hypothetical protein
MPETKRLNKPIFCRVCETHVNPFIVNNKTMELECPNCGEKTKIKNEG